MENSYSEDMNAFLVEVFNGILRSEEKRVTSGRYSELSIKEVHLIEAVCASAEGDNSAGAVAARLGITAGSLTSAVAPLIKKGYIEKRADDKDRRVARLYATKAGIEANEHHRRFHREMVGEIQKILLPEEIPVFVKALSGISAFFSDKAANRNRTGE